jgi:hypothetical protein
MSGYGFSLFGKKPKTTSMEDIDRLMSKVEKKQKEIEEKKAREEEARDNEAIRILEARAEEARKEREEMAVKGNSMELRTKNPETGHYDMGGRRRTRRKLRTKKSKKSKKSRKSRKHRK